MLTLEQYASIKDSLGLCYCGFSDEYIVQLKAIRPYLEGQFPNLKITIICKDESFDLLRGAERVAKFSELPSLNLMHIEHIVYDASKRKHPIESILKECGLLEYPVDIGNSPRTTRCVIMTKGSFPTNPLSERQIESLCKIAKSERYEVELDTNVENSGLVMGVESRGLFEAAVAGIETRLVPTGIGTRLYEIMFPQGKIIKAG